MARAINQSIQQVNSNTWLICGRLLCERISRSTDADWDDEVDIAKSYRLTLDPSPAPDKVTDLDSHDPHIQLQYDPGGCSAVWAIGNNAFCKVKSLISGVTPEKDTLAYVENLHNRKFTTPKVIYHIQLEDRTILILQRLPGRTLGEAWPTLDIRWKENYAKMIVESCKDLAVQKHGKLCGVDGISGIPEEYLIQKRKEKDFSCTNLQKACEQIGMDCSEFVFYHADLGPGNIIVEDDPPQKGTIGIIDWEIAGGLDLPDGSLEWRILVQELMGANNFESHLQEWADWWGYIIN
ncbi:hypothetical protein L228DRAFT_256802 [Xylona heveae TC161]|uniref:Aminoglycoside phosphotransferase domain-containing protein n=1 Tax=Xylona heveae (strain CBS 132557 / TC161) TaxID=1328760 RepID=A0A165AFL2_XYLHT|nr:hypothetical protein L228DRAFT_256802 [Xylona heveae TC161]KZF20396.1 hypothetical protein L228DRAFT_256802 [Xylona heveae TC161]